LNVDIGHLRHMRWVKDDNPNSIINNKPELTQNGKSAAQNRWIAYNKMRGQSASAMEHAAPDQFWVDRNTCKYIDINGNTKNPTLEPCAEAISAVKAIAVAQSKGQKIYTITPQNAATALVALPIGGDVGTEIRSAIQAGKEVMVHEQAINVTGWTGYGYIIVDPDTGAGSYLIEGRGNGAYLAGVAAGVAIGAALSVMFLSLFSATPITIAAGIVLGLIILLFAITALALVISMYQNDEEAIGCVLGGLQFGLGQGAAQVPHLITMIINSIFEFKVEARNAQACGF